MGVPVHSHTTKRRHGHSAPRGQFFTPACVASFLWDVVGLFADDPRNVGRVIDPAAGEGVLLDTGCDGGWVRPDDAIGLEIDADIARRRGDAVPVVVHADGLFDLPAGIADGDFDVAVGNPPFGRSRDLLTDAQRSRLATDPDPPIGIWGDGVRAHGGGLTKPSGSRRVEQLFLERALRLVGTDGLVAFILPDSLLSNRRERVARNWLADRARLLTALALPSSAFRRPGLNALAHLVVLRVGPPAAGDRTLLMERRHAGRGRLAAVLAGMLDDARALRSGKSVPGADNLDIADLRGRRWDAGFWIGRRQLARTWGPTGATADLGDFVELLTYGPIVTGDPARHVRGGVPSIRQGDFTETGLRRKGRLRVAPGSVHDPERSRVRRGDLLLPRSGGGSLGCNRVAVYEEDEPANVGCFVDLIRLRGLNPYFLWIFLRSRPGWGQIRSLINGVGTPNISFEEIRSLRIPVLPADEQLEYEARYRAEVLDLHRRTETSTAACEPAQARFRLLVGQLERRLSLDDRHGVE